MEKSSAVAQIIFIARGGGQPRRSKLICALDLVIPGFRGRLDEQANPWRVEVPVSSRNAGLIPHPQPIEIDLPSRHPEDIGSRPDESPESYVRTLSVDLGIILLQGCEITRPPLHWKHVEGLGLGPVGSRPRRACAGEGIQRIAKPVARNQTAATGVDRDAPSGQIEPILCRKDLPEACTHVRLQRLEGVDDISAQWSARLGELLTRILQLDVCIESVHGDACIQKQTLDHDLIRAGRLGAKRTTEGLVPYAIGSVDAEPVRKIECFP